MKDLTVHAEPFWILVLLALIGAFRVFRGLIDLLLKWVFLHQSMSPDPTIYRKPLEPGKGNREQ